MPKVVIVKNLRDLEHVCMTFCFGEWNTNLKYVRVFQRHPVYAADLTYRRKEETWKISDCVMLIKLGKCVCCIL
jgi:hypothetical protein